MHHLQPGRQRPSTLSPPPKNNVVWAVGNDKVAPSPTNVITLIGVRYASEAELSTHHFDKLFSTNDADELIPTLEVLIRDLQSQAVTLRERIRELVRAHEPVDSMRLPQIIESHPELQLVTTRMAEIAGKIESFGCFIKDIDQGLIDFPSELGEEVVFLCWQFGEPCVSAWHAIDSGFSDRQPIPGARRTYLN
jgi:hypothetical protein